MMEEIPRVTSSENTTASNEKPFQRCKDQNLHAACYDKIQIFQKRPNASEPAQIHPDASKYIQERPKRSEHVQALQRTCENVKIPKINCETRYLREALLIRMCNVYNVKHFTQVLDV